MELIIKTFDELTTRELYELLRLRSEIFVVEQDCVYQDLDYIDYNCVHAILADGDLNAGGKVAAYLRAYQKASEPGVWWLGRVVTIEHRAGLGSKIFAEGIRIVAERDPNAVIHIEAQCQAQGFYEKFGFRACSERFIMDELWHIKMELRLGETPDAL